MDQSLITKRIIANAFKLLMQKESFIKISVSDIMKNADMRRQTFYYHFQDKYELLEWIFKTESKENISDLIGYERWDIILKQIFVYFDREQKFYKNALAVSEQNQFIEYLYSNLKSLFSRALSDIHHPTEVTFNENNNLISSFLSHGLVGVIKDWIQSGCQIPPEEMAEYMSRDLLNKMHDKE
ncbi:MAG: dihydroxyacetone kinase transcriptional activator DhaS [Alkalibacterium sp.]|uniref:dihydroxyacetone kinase transcriptional activator DhaS n=1 Tax=Alkalibacterium sp. TaxID=1872447 RepID=UPI003970A6D9